MCRNNRRGKQKYICMGFGWSKPSEQKICCNRMQKEIGCVCCLCLCVCMWTCDSLWWCYWVGSGKRADSRVTSLTSPSCCFLTDRISCQQVVYLMSRVFEVGEPSTWPQGELALSRPPAGCLSHEQTRVLLVPREERIANYLRVPSSPSGSAHHHHPRGTRTCHSAQAGVLHAHKHVHASPHHLHSHHTHLVQICRVRGEAQMDHYHQVIHEAGTDSGRLMLNRNTHSRISQQLF